MAGESIGTGDVGVGLAPGQPWYLLLVPGKPTPEWLLPDSDLPPGKGKTSVLCLWHLEIWRQVTSRAQLCLGAGRELENKYLLWICLLWAPFSHLPWDFGRLVITVVCILERGCRGPWMLYSLSTERQDSCTEYKVIQFWWSNWLSLDRKLPAQMYFPKYAVD